MDLERLADPEPLFSRLSEDIVENAGFLFRANDNVFDIYADKNLTAALAVQRDSDHCMFWGNWNDIEIPFEVLPKDGIFVSACPPEIIEILKQHFTLDGEWPCWHYLAPDGYGPGEWDELGPLKDEDISFIAPFWLLGDDDREEHIRDRVKRFDSSCIREDGKPIAWTGLHFEIPGLANLGFAHTLEEHRRKGYQQLVTKALVNRLHERGKRTTCHVIKDNKASMKLCASASNTTVGKPSE